MESLIEYDKKYCQISYLQDVKAVYLKWIGFANFEQFKEACNFSLELLIREKASKMIADNRLGKAVPKTSQDWLNDDWFPTAFKAGYRTSAVIVSENIFNEIAVKNIVNQMDKEKFTVQYFKALEEAKGWVRVV